MELSKYSSLFKRIPSLEHQLNRKIKLSEKEIECLDIVYEYYNNTNSINEKNNLRTIFKKERAKLSIDILKKTSRSLNKKIIETTEYSKANTIFCYISFDNEIDTYYILNDCLKKNKVLAVPCLIDGEMIAGVLKDINDLKRNKYGILEPKKVVEVTKSKIDLIIVPAIAYNPLGYRIGYGKGFYDKFLKGFEGNTFGMVLKEYLSVNIIPDDFDEPVKRLFIE